MRLGTIAIAALLGMALGTLSLPTHAIEGKSADQKKARAAKAPPTHVQVYGRRVPVVPYGTTKQMARVPTVKTDLAVTGLHVPDTVRVDTPFLVSFYIRNNGSATVAQTEYKVAAGSFLPLAAFPIAELAAGVARNIPAGRDVRIEHTVEIRSDMPNLDAGWPILAAMVDPDGAIDEEDEDNNGTAIILPLVASDP